MNIGVNLPAFRRDKGLAILDGVGQSIKKLWVDDIWAEIWMKKWSHMTGKRKRKTI